MNSQNDSRKAEILGFLHQQVFDPILNSSTASDSLKSGIRLTIMRMNERDAEGIVHYYWSALIGTEHSTDFARKMRAEGFTRFEEVIDEFRERFNDKWLRPSKV